MTLKLPRTHVKPLNRFGAAFLFKLSSQEVVNMLLWEAFQPNAVETYARLPNLATNAARLDFILPIISNIHHLSNH